MSRDFSITLDGGFELGDADAFATVARRILGEKKYGERCFLMRTATLRYVV
jgi:hypothetical protein